MRLRAVSSLRAAYTVNARLSFDRPRLRPDRPGSSGRALYADSARCLQKISRRTEENFRRAGEIFIRPQTSRAAPPISARTGTNFHAPAPISAHYPRICAHRPESARTTREFPRTARKKSAPPAIYSAPHASDTAAHKSGTHRHTSDAHRPKIRTHRRPLHARPTDFVTRV